MSKRTFHSKYHTLWVVLTMLLGVIPIFCILSFTVDVYGKNNFLDALISDIQTYSSNPVIHVENINDNYAEKNQVSLSSNPTYFSKKRSTNVRNKLDHDQNITEDPSHQLFTEHESLNTQVKGGYTTESEDLLNKYKIEVDKEILRVDESIFTNDLFRVWLPEQPNIPDRIFFEVSHPDLIVESNEFVFNQDNYTVRHQGTVYADNDRAQLFESDEIKIIAHDVRFGNDLIGSDLDDPAVQTIPIEVDHHHDVNNDSELAYELEKFYVEEGEQNSDFEVYLKRGSMGSITVTAIENTEDLSLEKAGTQGSVLKFPTNPIPIDWHWNNKRIVTMIAHEDQDTQEEMKKIKFVARGGGQEEAVTFEPKGGSSLPVVSFDKEDSRFIESRGGLFDIKINIEPASATSFTLKFERSGTATWTSPNVDYVIKEPIEVSSNQGSMNIPVTIAENGQDELNETVILTLRPTDEYAVDEPYVHILTIVNEEDRREPEKPLVFFSLPVSDAHEGKGLHNVEIRILPVSPTNIMLDYKIGGNATPNVDYTVPTSVTLSANKSLINIPVTIKNDIEPESNETITFTLNSSSEYNIGSPQHTVMIIDDDQPAVVSFNSSSNSVREDVGLHYVIASINPAPRADFTLMYDLNGTATEGRDYTSPRSMPVSANQTRVNIPINVNDDMENESSETIILMLSDGTEYDVGNTFQHTLTILDNDDPVVRFTRSSNRVNEDVDTHTVQATINPTSRSDLILNYRLGGTALRGLDYRTSGSVSVDPNESIVEISIVVEDDMMDEDDETIILTLVGGSGYDVGNNNEYTLTIIDNDDPQVNFIQSSSTTSEDVGSLDVRVLLLRASPVSFDLNFSAGEGTATLGEDYNILTSVNVPAHERLVYIPIMINDDQEPEGSETVILTLSDGPGYTAGDLGVHTLTIIDNDGLPVVSIHEAEADEDSQVIQLPVTLDPPANQVVTVRYEDIEGSAKRDSDYIPSKGVIIFDPGATHGIIQITLKDNTISEDEEKFEVKILDPMEATISEEYGIAEATIKDDDIQTEIRIEDAVASDDATTITFQVHLSQPSTTPILIQYRTEDGTAMAGEDYTPVSGILDFAPGMILTAITVPLLHDDLGWGEETFSVHIESSEPARIGKSIAVATIKEPQDFTSDVLLAYTARFIRATSVHVVEALRDRLRPQQPTCPAKKRSDVARLWDTASAWNPSLGELLAGCSVSNSTSTKNNGSFSVWGRGAYRQFQGRDKASLSISSHVTTGMLGADYRWNPRWMAGLLFAYHDSDGSFDLPQESGDVQATLTGFYPYLSYTHTHWEIWLSGGLGQGNAQLNDDTKKDLTSRFGAIGVQGDLIAWRSAKIRYFGDALVTDAKVGSSDLRADVYRIRIGLEGAFHISKAFQPFVEANVRQDGGSAETGLGMELGGGVRIVVPQWQLRGELRSQRLMMHTADGFTEWGISSLVQIGDVSKGFMATLRPSWGPSQAMALYHQQTILDVSPLQEGQYRTELELGYGVALRNGTVRSIMGITEYSTGRQFRVGGQLRPWEQFSLSVSAIAYQQEATLGNFGVNMRGSIQY